MSADTILVLAPMPPFPTSAGNRRRLVTTCQSLQRAGFAVDLAYVAHEDQIYRRFGQHPPTDMVATAASFQRSFLIEADETIPLKTRARCFGIDDWCPEAVGDFVAWYLAAHPETRTVLVNYVFLSRALAAVPPGVLTLIDTHDRFADRQRQYRPFRAEPNFFYTDTANETIGLDRADIVLAIQSEEAAHFRALTASRVHLLPPRFLVEAPFRTPSRLARIGFIGHGNDPNRVSITRFVEAWAEGWTPARPELVIAGEICASFAGPVPAGVRLAGYVPSVAAFYEEVDLVVAPMLMGTGLKMKVAEALSFGVPVVGTVVGFEGFDPLVPAHRCEGAEDVKAQVLSLAGDAAGLAVLARACADLFATYNARAEAAETDLVAMIRDWRAPSRDGPVPERTRLRGWLAKAGDMTDRVTRPYAAMFSGGEPKPASAEPVPPPPAPPADPAPEPVAVQRFGTVVLSGLDSLDSALREHPDHGRLVATERVPAGADAAARAYSPSRRRWFATAADATAPRTAAALSDAGFCERRLALSPEWVRDRALPRAVREDLALLLSQAEPDWRAQARLVGICDGMLLLATVVPSHFLTAPREAAVFAVDRAGLSAGERMGAAFAETAAGWGAAFTARRRDELTPVPATLRLDHDLSQAVPGDRILVLTDDMIGVLDLAGPNGPGSPP
ncbi:glycosyltransferase family 4 protein [Methylobacterium sp. Leaf108]|uniref:glycosyltransferase n=1 Tax=Methylobacterium sp. Leaf108 TaxID=1736256 RepID=UPI0006F5FD22|nr:glycosyltransferase family 4 protein [Methylobacterium sp. Leaf108]